MKMQAFLIGAISALVKPTILLIQVLLLVPARVLICVTLRKRYPDLSINELVDACIKLTSFDAEKDN
ncbi:hypothetical protein HF295_02780 [Hujiaoplasma nucleasis]|uniref:Uncharacterized protein n=1 Tax=Hujiaoplasma nucleasis TaxID=2725268 RepID=A0A7L6N0R3_9MOLU|nr:hypothetical protein [Hujiaoplasma nucleasis]QLY39840.1 hypothetical protein HF295_02780 [Hujiaoplasma nucleasis]